MKATACGQRGLSLIELMIALLIGSLLILGLVQVFSASRSAYQLSEGMARVQENARFAMDFLQRDIRMAGHFGCVNDQAHWVRGEGDPLLHFGTVAATHPLNFAISIQGFEANGTAPGQTATIGKPTAGWMPAPPAAIASLNPSPGSDIIVLRYLGRRGTPVTNIEGAPGSETLHFPAAGWIGLTEDGATNPGLFGIGDCSHVDIFPGSGNAAGTVTVGAAVPGTTLADRFTPHPSGQTALYRADSVVYFVRPNSQGVPALHRARALANGGYDAAEELVEGVESLQFLYGQDQVQNISAVTPPVGNITVQHTAQGIENGVIAGAGIENAWRRVGLVQIGMLVRSPTRAAAPDSNDDTHPTVLGTVFQPPEPGDGMYRASYESTVALRNRLFGN